MKTFWVFWEAASVSGHEPFDDGEMEIEAESDYKAEKKVHDIIAKRYPGAYICTWVSTMEGAA